ncbi:hypothetical protein [Pseudidiomarina piscicola]|uniref:hypothetical protein n=1 Tax=Pseudidiomarina piscicola TaxID=2614830 RepID=UPI00156D4DC6|nr:hypothetical protein [Pseudidiomarina piscicola]
MSNCRESGSLAWLFYNIDFNFQNEAVSVFGGDVSGYRFFVYGMTAGIVMFLINVMDQKHAWTKASSSWIQGNIRELKQSDIPICVKVHIKCDDVDAGLCEGACPQGYRGGRKTTKQEQELIDAWNKSSTSLNGGNIHSSLQRVSLERC